MKKIILSLVLAIGFCFTSFSQSNNGIIAGYFTVILGQTTSFTVTEDAECDTCYKWNVNSPIPSVKNKMLGTLKIVGSENGKSITIEPTTVGVFSVNVVYTDEKGYHSASYVGNVVVSPEQITNSTSITALEESKKQ